jgi:hypothetical protein
VPHPNGALGLYSLCVTTPDFEGTISALQQSGLALRRVRRPDDATSGGRPMAFFKFGAPPGRDVILELVGPGASDGAAKAMEHMGFSMGEHAMIAGLVVEVPSISPIARLLGLQLLGAERDAAQGHGRRIAPLKHSPLFCKAWRDAGSLSAHCSCRSLAVGPRRMHPLAVPSNYEFDRAAWIFRRQRIFRPRPERLSATCRRFPKQMAFPITCCARRVR